MKPTAVTPPARTNTGTERFVCELRVTVPVTLDQWVREQADALGLSKSSFVRMALKNLQARVTDGDGD